MKVLGMIRTQFKDIDGESFVRPHMEFAIKAWSLYFKRDIECLEKVQHNATENLSYEEKLCKLGLTTLTDRRLRGDLI